ncbi:undecaprenyl-diphosphate phosphatase [Mesorhizobium sp.]|uniref:undecaprenyl-diphosphate phosphatase n=1 Tax=Mesorhizobium sp. TaxID=1871066 RepID=UPI000FE9A0EC|nr:undecaprenyl-diphosphate phosphatase [Mesorhizobium sp.]RWH32998.1 MAG: undecaprenyl-diphosphate phosphatase [Mesorhizobium sp.]RWH35608.1 MAG: undecaprenyl-diphosphate phosphatase [Mesorhizobium sp.]RWI21630.1 MAG: undecaprenyl-diphosphate phosphatase [Mesorhizobium sp.]TIM63208.1 MAG: undecaprenyl-diphosphate phosphatase [Mesorhizobium sp.]TIR58078.1 MAG: undecaprenyl-diphosphate phosphatase [Mesorhizobium sp.]
MTDVCTQGLDTGFVSLGYAKVAFLGIVQGITELLPISSTAHMSVVPAMLGWQDPGSAFSAAMQLATLAAVISYFWSDVREVAVGSLAALTRRDYANRYFRLAIGIVLATVPIVIAGLALSSVLNACNSPLRGLAVIGWACIAMAVLLALSEIYARHRLTLDKVSVLDALLVGVAQVGALIPGVSRSGSTLTAALGLGYARPEAARLSFLLGLPAIALAGLKELWELHKIHLGAYGWSVLAVGLVVASISAFFAIWGLMRVLERFSAWPFVIYRGLLGVVLLIGVAVGWLS